MEILDNQYAEKPDSEGLQVTRNLKLNWHSISKWAMFFAVLGFIVTGLSVLVMTFWMPFMQEAMTLSGQEEMATIMETLGSLFVGLGVVGGIVMFFIHFFHFRFSNDIQRAIRNDDQDAFESAWRNLRNHFRLFGIVIIAYIVLYVILLLSMGSLIATRPEFQF